MAKFKLLEEYKKLIATCESYEEKMTLSLDFLNKNIRSNIHEGEILIKELLAEAKEREDLSSLAKLNFHRAWVEFDFDRYLEGKEFLTESLRLFTLVGDRRGIMRVYTALGFTNATLDNPEEGFKNYQKALEIATELKSDEALVPIYGNMAVNFLNMLRYDDALVYYKKILHLEQTKENMVMTLGGLGYTYHLLGDHEQALEYLKRSLKLAEEGKIDLLKSETLIRIADVYREMGNEEEAFETYKIALAHGITNGLARIQSTASTNLGLIYENRNKLELALEYLTKAYEIVEEINVITSQIGNLGHIWRVLTKLDRWDEALSHLKEQHKKHLEYFNQASFKEVDRLKIGEAIREKELYQKMRSELALISMMGQELTSSLEFKGIKEIMKLIYEQVCDFMDTTLLALGLYDEDNKELKMQYYLGQEQWEASTLNIKENKSLFAWSINNRKEIIIRNLNKEYSLYSKDISKEELARKDINSFICVPLVIGAKVIGILSIQSKNLIAYSDYQMEMFKALSSFVAITLENADLYNEVKVMAITDPLTGIFNRRHFLNLANRELSIYKRYGQNFSLVMVDIDHFKMVNDQYGHDNGDVVLKEVSSYLARSLEATDILCRYGGEEFIILLTGLSLEKAVKKADKIREGLSNLAIKLNTGEMLSVKASFGVSEVLKEDEVLDKVIKRADLALYEAKEKGRNRVCSLAHDVIEEVNISS